MKSKTFKRAHPRFDVSHCEKLGGSITTGTQELPLATLGKGGCGFYSALPVAELAPPREVICTVYLTNNSGFEETHILMGNMLYITPSNSVSGAQFYYGVRFYEEDQDKLNTALIKLQELADRGEIQQV